MVVHEFVESRVLQHDIGYPKDVIQHREHESCVHWWDLVQSWLVHVHLACRNFRMVLRTLVVLLVVWDSKKSPPWWKCVNTVRDNLQMDSPSKVLVGDSNRHPGDTGKRRVMTVMVAVVAAHGTRVHNVDMAAEA